MGGGAKKAPATSFSSATSANVGFSLVNVGILQTKELHAGVKYQVCT